jgi:hypothetical protein
MRSRWRARGDNRQNRESDYLAEAIRYFTQNTQRPLWVGQRKTTNGVKKEPSPLYRPFEDSRDSFVGALERAFNKHYSSSTTPKDGHLLKYTASEDFLECFLERLNTPDLSPGYIFITAFNSTRSISNKFQKPAESLVKNLNLIGVDALNEAGYVQKAFPIALLTIMQDVTKSDPSLREGYLIDEVLERYQADLLSRHKEHLKSFVNSNPITQACMDVSLAKEIENFRAFLANRDNLLASAGQ